MKQIPEVWNYGHNTTDNIYKSMILEKNMNSEEGATRNRYAGS